MSVRSMTGFAQVKSQTGDGTAFTLSLKSVNHRFLDPQLRLPPEMDELEIKIRRILKERLARGHIEVTLSLERRGCQGFEFNRELVSGYVSAFRKAAAEFATPGEPDLNVVFRMPGALGETAARCCETSSVASSKTLSRRRSSDSMPCPSCSRIAFSFWMA